MMMPCSPQARVHWRAFLPWVFGFALLGAPLICATNSSNLSSDETSYYLPAVEQLRAKWPVLDLVADSRSATAPGYPYFLASLAQLIGSEVWKLRIVTWLVSLGVLAVLWRILRATTASHALWALAPLALSNFFVKSSGFVVTDNVALLLVSLALATLLFQSTARAHWIGAIATALAVMVRQTTIWLTAPALWKLWRNRHVDRPGARWAVWLLPLVPLAILFVAWRGLVPPIWRAEQYAENGITVTPLLYLAVVLLTMGVPFYAALVSRDELHEDLRSKPVLGLTLAGLALVLLGNSEPNYDAGHWGGYWWSIAARLPVFGSVSPLFAVCVPLGLGLFGALLRRLVEHVGRPAAEVWGIAFAAWAATTCANRLVFHRYFEPTTLVFLIIWVALILRTRPTTPLRRFPLFALSVVQAFLTLLTTHAQAYGLVRFG
ncbi:MAG: glycosyltransferase family 39 protein [Opitutus sp.]|nr:glycosyltransferase family 39 protein [Opitutus sp.]